MKPMLPGQAAVARHEGQIAMSDDTLLLLADEVRRKTLWLLDSVTDEMAQFAAPGLCNSILW